jgi:hypothetical protein
MFYIHGICLFNNAVLYHSVTRRTSNWTVVVTNCEVQNRNLAEPKFATSPPPTRLKKAVVVPCGRQSGIGKGFSPSTSVAPVSSISPLVHIHSFIGLLLYGGGPLMVAQWLRYCATNRKVAGSIPDGPGVDSSSNRNEYQEHFLLVKAAGA